jgi:hypothetical protein
LISKFIVRILSLILLYYQPYNSFNKVFSFFCLMSKDILANEAIGVHIVFYHYTAALENQVDVTTCPLRNLSLNIVVEGIFICIKLFLLSQDV